MTEEESLQAAIYEDVHLTDPELAAKYVQLKSSLAEAHRNDREAYTDAKGKFIIAAGKDALTRLPARTPPLLRTGCYPERDPGST